MAFTVKDLKFGKDALQGISEKTIETHHDRLYAGFVNKRNEITDLLGAADRSKAAQTYSEYRELKLEETFNADGQILHELYFDSLGSDGTAPAGGFAQQVAADFGSWDAFIEDAVACAMAARGWVVTPPTTRPMARSTASSATCTITAASGGNTAADDRLV